MSRRGKRAIVLGAVAIAIVTAAVWALPEVVRRAALDKIPALTGRGADIADIDINPFTGRFAVTGLRLAERDGPEPLLEVERIEGRISLPWLVAFDVRLRELTLVVPRLRVIRTGPAEFNFSDLLALVPAPDPSAPPSRWTVTIDRLRLQGGRIGIVDQAVSPAVDWSMGELDLDLADVSTRAGRPEGRGELQAQLGDARLRVRLPGFHLAPVGSTQEIALTGFDLMRLVPYLGAEIPARLEAGTLRLALTAEWTPGDAAGESRAVVRGQVAVEGLSLLQPGRDARIASASRIAVDIEEADVLARAITLASLEVDGLDFAVTRLPDGSIDVLAPADTGAVAPEGGPPAGAADPPAPAASPEAGAGSPPADAAADGPLPAGSGEARDADHRPWRVRVERLALREGGGVLVDQTLSPPQQARFEGLSIEAAGLSTGSDDPPGTLAFQTDVRVIPGPDRAFRIALDMDALKPDPLLASGRLAITGFELALQAPYLAQDFSVVPLRGVLDLDLHLAAEEAAGHATRAEVSGTVRVTDAALAHPGDTRPFAVLPGLAVNVAQADVLTRTLHLQSVEIDRPAVEAVRDERGAIDLIAIAAPASGPPGPAAKAAPRPPEAGARRPINEVILDAIEHPWRLALDRLALRGASAVLQDRAVSPATTWTVDRLRIDARALSTAPGALPGSMHLRARILAAPGATSPATATLDTRALRLVPLTASARLALSGFELGGIAAYVPETLAAAPSAGRLGAELTASVAQGASGLGRLVMAGRVELADVALTQRGGTDPFLSVSGLAVDIARADAVAREILLRSIEVEGPVARAVRDGEGSIDLLALLAPFQGDGSAPPAATGVPAPSGGTPSPGTPPAGAGGGGGVPAATTGPAWRFALDRFDLRGGTATFEERATEPQATFPATDLTITAERVAWPSAHPATFSVGVSMPGGGRTEIAGFIQLDPFLGQLRTSTRDAPIDPYYVYFPFAARFRGLFNGESLSEFQRDDDGEWRVASRGTGWATGLEVVDPATEQPVSRVDRLEIRGIDFSWPNYALVERVTFERPAIEIERDGEGVMNLRRLFEPRTPGSSLRDEARGAVSAGREDPAGSSPVGPQEQAAATPAPGERGADGTGAPAAPEAPEDGEDPLQTMVIDFQEIAIEDGYIRFLDRTTRPPFAQDMSQLALSIRDLSNVFGRARTSLRVQALVGGDAGVDLRGELSGIGETLRADLVGELRDYPLASANPYSDAYTAWIVEHGTLTARIHYRVEGDVITADNTMRFGGLAVERSRPADGDEVKNRIGLPLGLIVGLLKDTRGDIDFAVPLKGSLRDRTVDWGEAVWSGVKQAVLKLLAGPFRTIGRLFTGSGDTVREIAVDPVVFAAGSAVIAPEMERHLTRVADFLRQAPYVNVALRPVATRGDVESLKTQELTARIQAFQSERELADFGRAVTAYYRAQRLDGKMPETPEEQLAALQRQEPVPEPRVTELLERRLGAAREALISREGIPAPRVLARESPAQVERAGEGRVEFAVAAE